MTLSALRRLAAVSLSGLVVLASAVVPASADAGTGGWRKTSDMAVARAATDLALLPSGDVLAIGVFEWDYASDAELFDPVTRRWRATDSLPQARRHYAVASTGSGDVVVAGGEDDAELLTTSVHRFDAASGSWRATGAISDPRRQPAAATLADGRILLTGGVRWWWETDDGETHLVASSELYDPAREAWMQAAAATVPRVGNTLTTLQDGTVLSVGGTTYPDEWMPSAAVERYDPVADQWRPAASLQTPRIGHTAILLQDGRVLVLGGAGDESLTGEVYDPGADAWAAVADMPMTLRDPAATLLADGRVLVSGSHFDEDLWQWVSASLLYDPRADTWTVGPAPRSTRSSHSMISLPDGRALSVGGFVEDDDWYGESAEAEVFDPVRPVQPTLTFDGPTRVRPGGRFSGTAVLRDAATGEALPSERLDFTIIDEFGQWAWGDSECQPYTCETDADGTVRFSYTQEMDTNERVEAHFDVNGNRMVDADEPFQAIDIRWANMPTKITARPVIDPASAGGNQFQLTAKLVEAETGAPIIGEPLYFSDGQALLCEAVTDSNGVATCAGQEKKLAAVAAAGYRVRFEGTEVYEASSARGELIGGP